MLCLKDYEVELMENAPGGTEVITVEARDEDKEDYGVVNYKLDSSENRFDIDPTEV